MPSVSLLISTYNRPLAISLVLQSVFTQTELPDEIVIADDGSTIQTKETIAQFAKKYKFSIKHIWQEDNGFKKSMILNKAIANCTKEYIIEIDGDCILHPKFISDHKRFAKKGSFVSGSRALIDERLTMLMEENQSIAINFFSSGIKDKGNSLRLPFLWKFFQAYKRYKEPAKVRGCNMAFWRSDVIAINGYDESFTGWGHEDIEIAARFLNIGLVKRFLKFGAVQYHLYHKESSKQNDIVNKAKFFETEKKNKKRCSNGIDKYLK